MSSCCKDDALSRKQNAIVPHTVTRRHTHSKRGNRLSAAPLPQSLPLSPSLCFSLSLSLSGSLPLSLGLNNCGPKLRVAAGKANEEPLEAPRLRPLFARTHFGHTFCTKTSHTIKPNKRPQLLAPLKLTLIWPSSEREQRPRHKNPPETLLLSSPSF